MRIEDYNDFFPDRILASSLHIGPLEAHQALSIIGEGYPCGWCIKEVRLIDTGQSGDDRNPDGKAKGKGWRFKSVPT